MAWTVYVSHFIYDLNAETKFLFILYKCWRLNGPWVETYKCLILCASFTENQNTFLNTCNLLLLLYGKCRHIAVKKVTLFFKSGFYSVNYLPFITEPILLLPLFLWKRYIWLSGYRYFSAPLRSKRWLMLYHRTFFFRQAFSFEFTFRSCSRKRPRPSSG